MCKWLFLVERLFVIVSREKPSNNCASVCAQCSREVMLLVSMNTRPADRHPTHSLMVFSVYKPISLALIQFPQQQITAVSGEWGTTYRPMTGSTAGELLSLRGNYVGRWIISL